MQLNLNSFKKNKSSKTRVEESIASNLSLTGLDNLPGLSELLQDIFVNYELEKGVFKLIGESCLSCKKKLKRKGVYNKEITLPREFI